MRVLLFLLSANGLWLWGMFRFVERANWLWITPIALSINALLISYDWVLSLKPISSRRWQGQDPWGVLKVIHEISTQLGVQPPEVHLLETDHSQILNYARRTSGPRLYLSETALRSLNHQELRAVLTFQLLAIRGQLSLLNYWTGAYLDLFYRMGLILEKGFSVVFGWNPPVAAWVVTPWLILMRIFLLHRGDHLRLDQMTVASTERPRDLAQALIKLESLAQTKSWPHTWPIAHMCVVSPLKLSRVFQFLNAQPQVAVRVTKLIGHYPI